MQGFIKVHVNAEMDEMSNPYADIVRSLRQATAP